MIDGRIQFIPGKWIGRITYDAMIHFKISDVIDFKRITELTFFCLN